MKKLMILVAVLSLLISYSCSNDFELIEDWQDIPVVYGLLSRADTAHYIRVEKVFVDPSTSAFELAKIPDSLYYESIGVAIEHESSGTIYQLERVDGALEGYPRAEGIFANQPNYLYKFKLGPGEELIQGGTYKLKLSRGDDQPEVTASTQIVSDLSISSPVSTLNFNAGSTTNFRWRTEEDAVFFDLTLRLNYLENSLDDPNTFEDKQILWPLAKNIQREEDSELTSFKLEDGGDFFRFIALQLQDSGNLIRDFKSVDMIVTGGDQNLFDFINIGQANTGITSAQEIPTFTNLTEGGLGIFGSTNIGTKDAINLTSTTEDSLRFGQFTKDLNFQ